MMKISKTRVRKIEDRIPSLRPVEQYPARILELHRKNLAHGFMQFGCNVSPAAIDRFLIEKFKERRDAAAEYDTSVAAYFQTAIDQLESMQQEEK